MKVQLQHIRTAAAPVAMALLLLAGIRRLEAEPVPREVGVSVSVDSRVDSLQWSIPGTGGYPNIYSELSWWALLSVGATMRAHFTSGSLVLLLDGGLYRTLTGNNTDYDYLGQNRTEVVSYSENSSGGGLMADLKLGFGYAEVDPVRNSTMHFSLVVGPYVSLQNLVIRDGTQYDSGDPGGLPLNGISSTYDALWWGPWIGFSVGHESPSGTRFSGRLDAMVAFYSSTADWMRRTDFAHPVSFRQWALGGGAKLNLEAVLPLAGHAQWVFRAGLGLMTTAPGTDLLFESDGSQVYGTLNGATWTTISLSAGVSFAGP